MIRRAPLGLLVVALLAGCGDADDDDDVAQRDGGRLPNPDAGIPDADVPALDAGPPVRRDGGLTCATDVCDPRAAAAAASCAPPDRCLLMSSEPACLPGAGTSGEGALCRAVDQCAVGLACVDRVSGAVCASVCCPGEDAPCGEGRRCAEVARLVDGTEVGWGVCTARRPCDPFAPAAACEAGEGCYLVGGVGETDCRAAGIAVARDRCELQNDCVPGLFCAGRPGAARCERLCALAGASPSCPGSQRCTPLTGAPDGVGLCVTL